MTTIIIKNNDDQDYTINSLFGYIITASGVVTLSNYFEDYEIARANDLIDKVADGTFMVNNGIEDLLPVEGVRYCLGKNMDVSIAKSDIKIEVDISDELRDRSGKLRVHQTSRKIGTVIIWTGEGDDPSDPTAVGGGESFSFNYCAGQVDPLIKYIDFNIVENESWLHEGYISWKNCYLDTLDLQVVTRTTAFTVSSGTNYTLYGGYLIVPAAPGTGDITVTADLSDVTSGLVYMPPNDLGESPTAFWDAEWDTTTKKFINITPNYTGTGEYNLFTGEVVLAHFVRKLPLLNSGFIALNSSDTDQLGTGMRLRMVADTNTTMSGIGDHDWFVACTMCMHRAKTC